MIIYINIWRHIPNKIVMSYFYSISNYSEKTEIVPTTLLLPTIATTTTLSTQMALEKDSTEQMNYKNIVMSLYVPVTKLGPCRYIDGTRKQNHQCRRDPGLADALRDAKKVAMSFCKEQFKFDRWNCSIETKGKRNIFKKVRSIIFIFFSQRFLQDSNK